MTTQKTTIHDAVTGETITRDFNAAELAQAKLDQAQATKDVEARAVREAVREAARKAVLTKLGISLEEALALLG